MILTDEMKNLKIYRRPLWLPTIESDKKKHSSVFLLTPNYSSSKNMMMNPLLINKKRFESYYLEGNLTYFIKGDKALLAMEESYIRDCTEHDSYQRLLEMSVAERNALPDSKFGLPKKRKYPLHTKEHVRSAIRFFNYVDPEDEAELARNINKAIDKFYDSGESINVGEDNRFSKYYKGLHHESVQESVITEATRADIVKKAEKAFLDIGCKPNISTKARKKFEAREKTDFGDHLCIAGLGNEGLAKKCSEVNKIIKPLGGRVSADNYGCAFLSVTEAAELKVNLNDREIESIYGIWDKRGLYNACVKLVGEPKPLRGRSELLILQGETIFMDLKDNGRGYRLPGGGWDEDEDHMLTARREAREEARIIVKDIQYMGHYASMYTDTKDWVKEQIPEKDWWYGYYTELYVAQYDKAYTGYVEVLDRDTMAETGKFYPIRDVYHMLRKEHREAIDKYLSPVKEAYVVNKDDIYYNKEKFDKGYINLCFITGHSGSGKSTMGRNMSGEKVEHYELDDVLANYNFSDENLKEYGDLIYSFFNGPGKRFRYRSKEEWEKDSSWNSKSYYEDGYDCLTIKAFVKYAIRFAKAHPDTKYIIEGVWLYHFIKPSELKDFAVYIKGTSALISAVRAAKRNNVGKKGLDYVKSVGGYLGSNAKTYMLDEKNIQAYKTYFTKTVTNESASVNLCSLWFYHAEVKRKGFKADGGFHNWDEELYYKDIELAISHPYGGDVSDLDEYDVYVYTCDPETMKGIYLGEVHVYKYDTGIDFEWNKQVPIKFSYFACIRDSQRSSLRESMVQEACMETFEELYRVAEMVQKMVMKNPYIVPFSDFIEIDDGLAVCTMQEEAADSIVAILNEKLEASILRNYHVEKKYADLATQYLVVYRNDPSTYIAMDDSETREKIRNDIMEPMTNIAESSIMKEGWIQSVFPINTPETPILSVSAIITNGNYDWLVLDHVKCNAWTVPGGKVDAGETEEEAIRRELKEELGIVATDFHKSSVQTFICEYPAGSGTYAYFKNVNYFVDTYMGELQNVERNKHRDMTFMHPSEILSNLCGDGRRGISILLRAILSNHEYFSRNNSPHSATSINDTDITCSGYESDLTLLSRLARPVVYTDILRALRLIDVVKQQDLPILHIIAIRDNGVDGDIQFDQIDGREHVYIYIRLDHHKEDGSIISPRVVIESTMYMMILGILMAKYPASRNTILPKMIADYLCGGLGLVSDDYYQIADYIFNNIGITGMTSLLPMGDVTSLLKIARHIGFRMEPDDFLLKEATTTIDANNLASKIKYATTTKLKRKNGTIRNKTKNLVNNIVDDIKRKTTPQLPSTPTSPSTTSGSEEQKNQEQQDQKELQAESLLVPDVEYSRYGNMILVEDAKYDPKLRTILYRDRIIRRKDLLERYDQVKKDNPDIKYTFPEIERYRQKNIFVDLSYYNEVFFKNNDWKKDRGYELYFDLLDRLLNDRRFASAGYTKRTVFIPILDWDKNKATRMWLYREDINPISLIYEGMNKNPARLKKIFGKMDFIFFANGRYFKMNFSEIDDLKKASLTFLRFIRKIRGGEEFDAGDIDTSAETQKSIQTSVIDKIEDGKGVDLTPTVYKVKKEREEAVKKQEEIARKKNSNIVATAPDPIRDGRTSVDQEIEKQEKDPTVSKLSQDTQDVSQEKDKEKLARVLVDIENDNNVNNVDDALDAMDSDYVKNILMNLDRDDMVKISDARAARMMELDKEFLQKDIKGRSVKEILEKDTSQEKLPETTLKVASPNEQWNHMQYMNFGKTYDVDADIIKAFQFFGGVSHPLHVREMTVTDNSTSEDRLELYTVSMEDYRGTRYTVRLDIPVEKNRRYLLRGGERNIQTQFCNMPIIKTDLDSCQVVSNYNKIIVTRFNTSSGRSLPQTSRFIKAASKYEGKKIKFVPGNNTQICAKYDLPIDYIDLSSVFSKIETEDFIIYFDQDEIRKTYPIDEKIGIPFAYHKKEKMVNYLTNDAFSIYTNFTSYLVMAYFHTADNKYKDFMDLYYSTKPINKGTYSRASIMSSKIPLVVVCAYSEGLTTVLKKANIQYNLVEKLPPDLKNDPNKDYVKFKDGYLSYTADYNASLLLNGLKDCSTEIYSIGDIDDRNMYLDFLDDFGGRIKADGLDNAYDCTIDPITKEMLEFYKLPTDYISVLLYTNILLSDNKFVHHTDTSSRRIRKEELIAAYTFKVLAEAYRTYANEIKHGGSRNGFSVKQSAVIDKFLLDTTTSDSSVINMLNDVETTNSITTKGLSGMNSDRAYSLDKRTYDESMLNALAMSTGFSGNVGITRQATMNMNVDSNRGFVKSIHGDTTKMNTANTLGATEALIPMSTTHDDPIRVAMSFIQTSKHSVRTVESDPLLVTNGADEALPYIASDLFAFKAKQDGVVKEVTEQGAILEYKDGSKEYIDLTNTIQKNSDGGFYVPLKLDLHEKLKEGSKFKAGDIVAYDRKSISNSLGESDNLAYNVGKLAKVAIINTDEGFEDSGIVTESMSHKLATPIIEKMEANLDKNTNIFNLIKVGTHVEEGDTLLIWQTPYDEEDVSALLKAMADDREAVSELGRHKVKSTLTGTIVGIKIYRTVEMEELSESLQKAVRDYEKSIKELKKKLDSEKINSTTLPATYSLDATGKLKNTVDGVKIEFYVEYNDILAVGDKIVYNAANKAVIKNVLPSNLAPTTDFRPNEPVDALVSVTSIDKRMVSSTLIYGSLQKLMVELDRSCKEIAGIPYDDSTV